MAEISFRNKRLLPEKLESFGFCRQEDEFCYITTLVDGQFHMNVTANADGVLHTEVIDTVTCEEYVLHLVPEAAGAFVGKVREEYEKVLSEIGAACFEMDVFQTDSAYEVLSYAQKTYGSEPEYLWEKFPDNAVLRREDNQKWYAAILTVIGSRIGLALDEKVEVLDLRVPPEKMEEFLERDGYLPGYHMNKKHWISILLDGTVPIGEIFERIDESYQLAKKK